ncbi:MAG: hypothetical protein EXR97_01290 [Nitrospiraceae bacterium]|nr:hypothetical protein [Nitrospiraceae bacterium]
MQKNKDPELVYPSEKVHPASKFSIGTDGSAKSSLYNLHFLRSGYSYTIYHSSAVFDENGAGIMVKTPDDKSSHLACKETDPPDDLYKLFKLGLRTLPWEALVAFGSFGAWPAGSPNVDLLQGVKTHDFALVTWALENGADVNFHSPHDVGVLGHLIDRRHYVHGDANKLAEFDEETDRLLTLLLSRGASPTISRANDNTAIDSFLIRSGPSLLICTLLDAGWPNDYHYRLYVGAQLGDRMLVKEALDHGADPNKPIRGGRILATAIIRATQLSYKGKETEQANALAASEQLLKAGAKIDEGTLNGGGDIPMVYSSSGNPSNPKNIRPVLDLLLQYATPAARENSLSWLRKVGKLYPQRQADLDWLIKRLDQ